MKKIFFAFPSNRTGTVNRVAKGLSPDNELYGLNHMNKSGVDAEYCDIYPPFQRILDLFFLPLYKLFQRQIDIGFHLGRAILSLAKINRADVVITNTDSIGLPVCFLKRLGFVRPPVIYAVGLFYIQGDLKLTVDSDKKTLFRSFYTWILSGADHIIYHSPIEKEKLVKFGLYNPAYCTFVAMGSDGNFFKLQQSTINNQQSTIILAVGRDHARDYKTLFEAAEKLPDVEFVVICSRRNIEGLSVPKNIKILFDLTYREVADWYRRAMAVVIPMREMHRSSGQMTLTDSFQAGKPIIASDVVGIAHYGLKNGQDALLVSPGNAKQLAEAINKLTLDGNLRRKLGQGTRKLAQRFTTENYAKNIAETVKLAIDKIRLRPLEKKDLEFLRRIRNDNRQYFLDSSYISKPAQQKWFNQYRRKTGDYMFILEDKEKSVGAGAIYNIDLVNKTAEIGRFVVDKQFHGKGYGRLMLNKILFVAKNELRLNKLKLEAYNDNKKAIGLYRAEGFKIQDVRKSGRKQTVLMVQSFHATNEQE